MAAVSGTATTETTVTSGHANNRDDSNRQRRRETATADMAATSRHVDNIDSGNKTTMNMLTAIDGITVADTMMIERMTAGMTTKSGSFGINVAPTAIPTSIVMR